MSKTVFLPSYEVFSNPVWHQSTEGTVRRPFDLGSRKLQFQSCQLIIQFPICVCVCIHGITWKYAIPYLVIFFAHTYIYQYYIHIYVYIHICRYLSNLNIIIPSTNPNTFICGTTSAQLAMMSITHGIHLSLCDQHRMAAARRNCLVTKFETNVALASENRHFLAPQKWKDHLPNESDLRNGTV